MAGNYKLYMHINKTNHKKYIGITCQTVKRRWNNGRGYMHCPIFYNAILKYGWTNFEHIIILRNLSKEEAEAKEQEYIKKYKSNIRAYGYNMQNGGRVRRLSEKEKENLRIKNIGRKHSLDTRRKMSESHKGNQYCLGHKQSIETIKKRREKQSGINHPKNRKVYQYDLEGNFIKSFYSMQKAIESLGYKNTSHISQCCTNKRKKAYGYMWSYQKESKNCYKRKKIDYQKRKRIVKSKKILCFDKNNNKVAVFQNKKEAVDWLKAQGHIKANFKSIERSIYGIRKSYCKLKWRYENEQH